MSQEKGRVVSLYMTYGEIAALDEMAAKDGDTRSGAVRKMIRAATGHRPEETPRSRPATQD